MPPFALDSRFWSISSLAPNPLQQKSREPPENAKKIPPYVPKKKRGGEERHESHPYSNAPDATLPSDQWVSTTIILHQQTPFPAGEDLRLYPFAPLLYVSSPLLGVMPRPCLLPQQQRHQLEVGSENSIRDNSPHDSLV